MNTLPFVSVIIPCLNEENFIDRCLDSVIANDYPKDRLEVLIMDGISEDRTRTILKKYTWRYSFIKVFDNNKKITPAALNIGVRNAKGEIIMRMDAHSTYEKNYISKCVRYLKKYNADNVGGIWNTIPRNNSTWAKALAFSLSHSFGVGNAHYKIGNSKKPKFVDTVPFGCFRKSLFNRIGFFDESSHRNEDIEFNARLRKAGGKILMVPEIVINYYARTTFRSFCKHSFDNGLKVTSSLRFDRMFFSCRHLVPLIFVSSLFGSLGLWGLLSLSSSISMLETLSLWIFLLIAGSYALCNLLYSSQIAFREKDLRYLFLMPLTFLTLHIAYGLGSLWGVLKVIISKQFWENRFIPRAHY